MPQEAKPQEEYDLSGAIALLKKLEGCKLKAYWDSKARVWTIGWGQTGPGIVEHLVWTQQQADDALQAYVKECSGHVSRIVEARLTQNQHNAMISLVYNVGPDGFKKFPKMLAALKIGDFKEAEIQFKDGCKIKRRDKEGNLVKDKDGKPLLDVDKVMLERRIKEWAQFMEPDQATASSESKPPKNPDQATTSSQPEPSLGGPSLLCEAGCPCCPWTTVPGGFRCASGGCPVILADGKWWCTAHRHVVMFGLDQEQELS